MRVWGYNQKGIMGDSHHLGNTQGNGGLGPLAVI